MPKKITLASRGSKYWVTVGGRAIPCRSMGHALDVINALRVAFYDPQRGALHYREEETL